MAFSPGGCSSTLQCGVVGGKKGVWRGQAIEAHKAAAGGLAPAVNNCLQLAGGRGGAARAHLLSHDHAIRRCSSLSWREAVFCFLGAGSAIVTLLWAFWRPAGPMPVRWITAGATARAAGAGAAPSGVLRWLARCPVVRSLGAVVQAATIAVTSASGGQRGAARDTWAPAGGAVASRCMRVWATIGGRRPARPPRHPLWHVPIASSPQSCRPRSPPPASPAGELAGHTDWWQGRARSIAGIPGCRGPGWAPNPLRPRCSQGLPGLRPPQRGGPGPAAACRGSQPPAAAGGSGSTGGSAGGAPRAGRPLRRRQGGAGALREGHGEAVEMRPSAWAA